MKIKITILFLVTSIIFAEEPDTTEAKIFRYKEIIENACSEFEVNPTYLAAIIYVERTLNYDWEDDTFDILLADLGMNSSIGFCQIKMKTAYWIELQYSDSTSEYYAGKKYYNFLSESKSKDEIVRKLQEDKINIRYAAAYLRIFMSYWRKKGYPLDEKPEILGTLYSTGMFYSDGKVRQPRANPESNEFGKLVEGIVLIYNEGLR